MEFLRNVGIKSSITILFSVGNQWASPSFFMEQYIGKVRLGCQMSKTKRKIIEKQYLI